MSATLCTEPRPTIGRTRRLLPSSTTHLSITKQLRFCGSAAVSTICRAIFRRHRDQRRLDRLHLGIPSPVRVCCAACWLCEGADRPPHVVAHARMGIEALYRRPRTTKPEPGHKIHPYLLRGMAITRPNQVWAMDITYIPMARGFVYLAVVLDWATRRFCLGGCRSRWRRPSASRRRRMPCSSRQAGDLQHRPRLAVHRFIVHRSARQSRHRHKGSTPKCT